MEFLKVQMFAAGATGLIAAGLGISSFSLAGLYSNHADLSPRYSPLLLGVTNTIGAIPGIVGVMVTGALLDQTGSWPVALFAPSVFFFLTATAVFTIYGSAERQDFSEANNQPFW
jgi:MFS transporter, ACS family, solute carrier family 17 (sodium-dependent inorganic phosphate cotransporter), other